MTNQCILCAHAAFLPTVFLFTKPSSVSPQPLIGRKAAFFFPYGRARPADRSSRWQAAQNGNDGGSSEESSDSRRKEESDRQRSSWRVKRKLHEHVLGPTIAAVVSRGGVEGGKAKMRLLKLLPYVINLNSQRAKLEMLILDLERQRHKPLTEGFADLGLNGSWLLLFSSTTLGSPVHTGLRIRKIGQRFDVKKKELVNFAEWSLINQEQPCEAVLFVRCRYKFVTAVRMEVEIVEHQIRPLEEVYKNRGHRPKSVFPKDLQGMVEKLQRSLPREFFDPSGKSDITYLDTDCRISRFVGKRLAGVRNVFVRDSLDVTEKA